MAQKSGFFNSVGGDRKYKAEDHAEYFQTIISTGVHPVAGSLAVTANNTMQLTISAGRAFIEGYYYKNDSDYTLTLDAADAILNRIDRIVLRLDYVNRLITLAVLKGTPASSPAAPSLTRNTDKYEICIAEVLISAGVTGIAQVKVTDKKSDTTVCGYMKGSVIFDENEEVAQLETNVTNLSTTLGAHLADNMAHGVGNKLDKTDYLRAGGYAVTSGTSTAYTITLNPVPTAYADGQQFIINPHVDCGEAPTLNVNGLGAGTILKQDGSAIVAGDIKANKPLSLVRVGSNFFIRNGSDIKIAGQRIINALFTETISQFDAVFLTQMKDKLSTPTPALPGISDGVCFSPDGTYLAIGSGTTPYITIYKRSGDTFTKLTDPALLPTGKVRDAVFTSDGIYLITVHENSPYITIYKRSGDTFTKLANPSILPPGHGMSVAISGDDKYVAVFGYTSPYITIYKHSGDTFTKLAGVDIVPPAYGCGACFSPDGTYLVVGTKNTSPYITIYKRSGDTFTKLANPSILPPDVATFHNTLDFSPDGIYLAVSNASSPYITIYKRNGDTFTKLANPDIIPNISGGGVSFSKDNRYLAYARGNSPYIMIYSRHNDVFIKTTDPPTLPTACLDSIKFSNDGIYLVGTSDTSPYVALYKMYWKASKSDNSMTNISTKNGAGYAKQAGAINDTKQIVSLWEE